MFTDGLNGCLQLIRARVGQNEHQEQMAISHQTPHRVKYEKQTTGHSVVKSVKSGRQT